LEILNIKGLWTGSNTSSIDDGDNTDKSYDQAKSHVHSLAKGIDR